MTTRKEKSESPPSSTESGAASQSSSEGINLRMKDFDEDDGGFILEPMPERLTHEQVKEFDKMAGEYFEILQEVKEK